MLRWSVLLLGLLLVAGQAAGYIAIAAAETCSQPCPDDDSSGRCSPTCVCMGCCAYRGPAVVATLTLGDPIPISWSPAPETDLIIPSPDPRSILHIPKPSLIP